MSKQDTAISFLIEKLEQQGFIKLNCLEDIGYLENLITKSKELQKQQIIDAWVNGKENDEYGFHISDDAAKYFNETFNQ